MIRYYIGVLTILCFFCSNLLVLDIEAQSLTGIAYRVIIDQVSDTQTGTLISLVEGKYKIADFANASYLVGVINLSPQIEIDTIGNPKSVPLVKSGLTYVRVNEESGEVKAGSFLAPSQKPGVASLASKSQLTILGQALEDYNGTGEGLIKVDVSIQNKPGLTSSDGMKFSEVARESFFELFKVFRNASQVPAPQAFKFVLSGLILVAAVLFGFFTFGRVAQRGVEAIGRNPLAKNTILAGLIINVFISVAVIFSGLLAAYYIIRL